MICLTVVNALCLVAEQAMQASQSQNAKVVIPLPEESENVTRWIVDQSFRRDQERLKIPFGECFLPFHKFLMQLILSRLQADSSYMRDVILL